MLKFKPGKQSPTRSDMWNSHVKVTMESMQCSVSCFSPYNVFTMESQIPGITYKSLLLDFIVFADTKSNGARESTEQLATVTIQYAWCQVIM